MTNSKKSNGNKINRNDYTKLMMLLEMIELYLRLMKVERLAEFLAAVVFG